MTVLLAFQFLFLTCRQSSVWKYRLLDQYPPRFILHKQNFIYTDHLEIRITQTYSTVSRHSVGAVLLDHPLTLMYQASATPRVVLVHTPLTALPPLSPQHHPASSRSFLLARYCVHLWPPPSPSYSFLAPYGVLTSSVWFPISLQMSRFSPASAMLGTSFCLDLQLLSSRQTHQVVCWLVGSWETQLLNISEGTSAGHP